MKYASVCSGIEAATVAWEPLGWEPEWFSEIDAFPCAVLDAHYPHVPNLGNMEKIDGEKYRGTVELMVGGTPCQSFSIAGLRGGLADDRGNLAFEYCRLLSEIRPRWFVWENVPGVLSSWTGDAPGEDDSEFWDGHRAGIDVTETSDFACIIEAFQECGYCCAWRVLDAQYFGVPQRRRRVFVVGYLGDWRYPAAVLFESEGLSWDRAPRKEEGQSVAGTLKGGSGERGYPEPSDGNGDGLIIGSVAHTNGQGSWVEGAGTLRAREQESHEHLIAFTCKDYAQDAGDTSPCLRSMGSKDGRPNGGGQVAIAMQTAHTKSNGDGISQDVAYTLEQTNSQAVLPPRVCPTLTAGGVGTDRAGASEDIDFMQVQGSSVRRLMPIECERLQGFPDGYTRIPYKKKTAAQCPDGPRYKALGNSMAVPVMHWIGRRIQMLEDLMKRNRIETIT